MESIDCLFAWIMELFGMSNDAGKCCNLMRALSLSVLYIRASIEMAKMAKTKYMMLVSMPPQPSSSTQSSLTIMKRVPTQRTTTRITTLKPPKQTRTMKRILARLTLLARQLPVRTNNAVTNRTLRLPLHRSRDVLPPSHQPIDDRVPLTRTPGGEVDNPLRVDEPEVPLFLCDRDAVHRAHFGASQGVGFWEGDGDGHCLFVDGDGSGDFASGGGDFDGHWLVCRGLGWGPRAHGGKFGGDEEG